jgi:hypothetical protein
MIITKLTRSRDILAIQCTLETANRFRKTAGAPYLWWSPDDNAWLINVHALPNAQRLAAKMGIATLDNRPEATPMDNRPEWCGQCDRDTRHLPALGDAVVRCPRCHPNAGQPTTTQTPDVPPETEIWREGLARVRAELARVRNPPANWTPDDDPDLPF